MISIFYLTYFKKRNLNLPIGQIFVGIYFIMQQMIKLMLSFGLKNNINIINLCHASSMHIKCVAFCFMILDTILVKSKNYQILY